MEKAEKRKIPSGILVRAGIMVALIILFIIHYNIRVKDVVVYEDVTSDSITNTVQFPFEHVTGYEFLNHDYDDAAFLEENPVTFDLYLLDSEENIVWEKVYHDVILEKAFQEIDTCIEPGFYVSTDEVYTVGYSSAELYYMQRATVRFLGEPRGVGGIYFGICVAISLFVLLILILSYKKDLSLQVWAVILIMGLGILFNLVMPPLSVPDEPYHFSEAYFISDQLLGTESEVPGEIIVSEDLNNVQYCYTKQSYYSFWSHIFDKGMQTEKVSYQASTTAGQTTVPSYTFWPAGLGITLARIMHLNYQGLLLMGRFMNLIFGVICIYWAIRIIPIGKKSLLALSILPMNVCQIASFSYDSVNYGLLSLCIAFLVRFIYQNCKVKWKEVVVLSVLMALVIPIKVVYLPILLLVILIPKERFQDKKDFKLKRLCIVCGGMLPLIAQRLNYILKIIGVNSVAMISHAAVLPSKAEQADVVNTPAFYTFGWAMEHPIKTLMIYLTTLYEYLDEYWLTAIGWKFNDVRIPYTIIFVIAAAVLLIVITELKENKIGRKDRAVWGLVFVAGSIAIMTTMFFAFTPFGNDAIIGVQGRYFLPLGMCLPFILGTKRIKTSKDTMSIATLVMPLMDILVMLSIFSQTMRW